MKDEFISDIEKKANNNFIAIPVEHLVIDSIDRLGDYLLISVQLFQFDDYYISAELNNDEKKLISILASKQELINKLNQLQDCTVFIRSNLENKDIDQVVFDVERACDLLVISQYRYDRKEWCMGKPGAIGPYLVMFNINIVNGNIKTLL